MEDTIKGFQGNRLRSVRTKRGMSQNDIALRLQINQTQYARYENDRATPSLDIVIRIAEEFGVSLDWLVGLSTQQELHRFVPSLSSEERLLNAFREGDLETLLRVVVEDNQNRKVGSPDNTETYP